MRTTGLQRVHVRANGSETARMEVVKCDAAKHVTEKSRKAQRESPKEIHLCTYLIAELQFPHV